MSYVTAYWNLYSRRASRIASNNTQLKLIRNKQDEFLCRWGRGEWEASYLISRYNLFFLFFHSPPAGRDRSNVIFAFYLESQSWWKAGVKKKCNCQWQKKRKNYFNIPLEKRMTLFRDAVFLLFSPSLQIHIMLRHYQHAHVRCILILYRLWCRGITVIQSVSLTNLPPSQLFLFFNFIFSTGLGKLIYISSRVYVVIKTYTIVQLPDAWNKK